MADVEFSAASRILDDDEVSATGKRLPEKPVGGASSDCSDTFDRTGIVTITGRPCAIVDVVALDYLPVDIPNTQRLIVTKYASDKPLLVTPVRMHGKRIRAFAHRADDRNWAFKLTVYVALERDSAERIPRIVCRQLGQHTHHTHAFDRKPGALRREAIRI